MNSEFPKRCYKRYIVWYILYNRQCDNHLDKAGCAFQFLKLEKRITVFARTCTVTHCYKSSQVHIQYTNNHIKVNCNTFFFPSFFSKALYPFAECC